MINKKIQAINELKVVEEVLTRLQSLEHDMRTVRGSGLFRLKRCFDLHQHLWEKVAPGCYNTVFNQIIPRPSHTRS